MAFQLFVKSVDGTTHAVNHVQPDHSVQDLKGMVAAKTAIPAEEQVLVFNGRQLISESVRTLNSHGLTKNATVHLTLRLVGGTSYGAMNQRRLPYPGEFRVT